MPGNMLPNFQPSRFTSGSGASISFDSALTVADDAAVSTVIATASVSGQDGPHTFTLTNDAGGQFAINSSTGAITVAAALTAGAQSIGISATNGVDDPVTSAPSVSVNSLPVNTVAPSVSAGVAGDEFTATPGTSTGFPTPVITGQWRLAGADIVGEDDLTYQSLVSDAGALVYRETATNVRGSVTQDSNAISLGSAAFDTAFVLLWSQSNGGTNQIPSGSVVLPSNTFYWDGDTDAPVDAVGDTDVFSNSNRFGPYVQWAIRFRADHPSVKIVFIDLLQHAAGISLLNKHTENYTLWMERIGQAYTHYTGLGDTVEFYQMLTQQGESDFVNFARYDLQWPQFIADVRADVQTETGVNIDTMPITIGLPSDDYITSTGRTGPDDVPQILIDTPDTVLYTAVADTRASDVVSGDEVHFDEAGLIQNGNIHYDARASAVANTTYPFPNFTGTAPEFTQVQNEVATFPDFTGTAPEFTSEKI